MVSPPTLQRHELGKSIHATFLYPTSFLPSDTRYQVHTYLVHNTYLTKTKINQTHAQTFWGDVAIRNSLRSNNMFSVV